MYQKLLDELVLELQNQDIKITCAESCTGGLLASVLTEVSGSSKWFDMGFITYSNEAKHQLLKVELTTLAQFGAVSEQTAEQMAKGALKEANADYALSITGIAGPTGGSKEKPVGTVCFGLSSHDEHLTYTQYFSGARQEVRQQAVMFCLKILLGKIKN